MRNRPPLEHQTPRRCRKQSRLPRWAVCRGACPGEMERKPSLRPSNFRRTAPNFAFFYFALPLLFSFFSPSLWGSPRGILVVFLKTGTLKCDVWALGLSCEIPGCKLKFTAWLAQVPPPPTLPPPPSRLTLLIPLHHADGFAPVSLSQSQKFSQRPLCPSAHPSCHSFSPCPPTSHMPCVRLPFSAS